MYHRVVDDINVFSCCLKYTSKYNETFWNVFNTQAATLPLELWVNNSMQRRYQHSWTLLDSFNTAYRDIEWSHRRRIAINILIVFGGVSKVTRHLSIAMCYIWTSISHKRCNHLFECSSEMLLNLKMVSILNFYDDQCDIDVSSSRWRYERFFFLCQVYVEVQRNIFKCV